MMLNCHFGHDPLEHKKFKEIIHKPSDDIPVCISLVYLSNDRLNILSTYITKDVAKLVYEYVDNTHKVDIKITSRINTDKKNVTTKYVNLWTPKYIQVDENLINFDFTYKYSIDVDKKITNTSIICPLLHGSVVERVYPTELLDNNDVETIKRYLIYGSSPTEFPQCMDKYNPNEFLHQFFVCVYKMIVNSIQEIEK